MGIIRKLDAELIKRIAAGEVIERPSSIVKELIENSIDAGASRINVELSNGGLTSMKVTDNGIGIAAEDIPLLIDRHVTSKVHDIEDLERVGTLGFRGEAIYSIASVSRFILRTRHRGGDAGTELSYLDGEKKIRTIPHPVGTSIEASAIFYNMPARRKFLKSASGEYARCAEVVTRYALAYPQIAFEIIHDGRVNLQTTGGGAQDALLAVFGKTEARQFLPLTFRDQRVGIRGQISEPSLTRTTRKDQTFTINGRVIFDIALNLAFERAYAKLIAEGKRPLCILDVSIDPEAVDVNVHPHKREVRLSAPRAVYDAIQRSAHEALLREIGDISQIEADSREESVETGVPSIPATQRVLEVDDVSEVTSFISFRPKSREPVTMEDLLDQVERERGARNSSQATLPITDMETRGQPKTGESFAEAQHAMRVGEIMQVDNTYLIINRGDTVFVADQHNLHETLLYRRMKNAGDAGVVSQKLLFPMTVEFTPETAAIISDNRDFLGRMGYFLEGFGGGSFLVRAIPDFVEPDYTKEHLLGLFDEVGELKGDDFEEKFIVTSACKAAIKAGTRLSTNEMHDLASRITGSRGFNCPHGRPAVVALDGDWFARTFKRPAR